MSTIPKDIKELSDFQENLIKPIHISIARSHDDQWETFEDYKRLGFTFEETIKAIQGISNAAGRGSQKDTPVVTDEVVYKVRDTFQNADWGSFEEYYSLGVLNTLVAVRSNSLSHFSNNFPELVSEAKESANIFKEISDEFLK